MSLYRGMDAEMLEIEYSPSSMIGGEYQKYIDRYEEESAQARQSLSAELNIPFGARPSQKVDLFHADGDVNPLHVFLHGGYWQELSAKESAVMATALNKSGITLGVINYTLAPDADIDQMIEECFLAVSCLLENAESFGLDAANVTISGHSAGAQLIWMMIIRHHGDALLKGIKLVLLISGIYDLVPLCFTSVNEPLGLSVETAYRLSPMHNHPISVVPSVVAVAENDTREFRRQALDFYHLLESAKSTTQFVDLAERNHFDIILDLESSNRTLLDIITESAKGGFT